MSKKPSISYKFAVGEFDAAMKDIYRPIAEAGTAAMKEAGDAVKKKIRGNIVAAGFSKRWANAMRVENYPKKGASANAALHAYHEVPYADVFASGAVLRGKPMMWIPMPGVPKKLSFEKLTPKRFASEVGDLISLVHGRSRPLLMAKMRVSAAAAKRGPPYKIRMSALIRGSQKGTGTVVWVPVFIGVPTVKIGRKFDVKNAIDQAVADLPGLYLKHLDPDA